MGSLSVRGLDNSFVMELLVRIILVSLFCYMETMHPFVRYVSPAALESDYKHPMHDSYVPAPVMWAVVVGAPCLLSLLALCQGDREDAIQSFRAVTLALSINGVVTNTMKLCAGRLRPDFFYRCFPDGNPTPDMVCTGDEGVIIEGRKSFPSGHSSFSFCSLGFLSVWACGRLGVAAPGRAAGGLATVVALAPLYVAGLVALSRTCDYHHHWEDVTVGSLLGLSIAYFCYRQRYPPLGSQQCGIPYTATNPWGDLDDLTPLTNGRYVKRT